MPRRRFVQINGELVEVTPDYQSTPRTQAQDGLLWGDRSYDGLRATDGADISSRTKHREYMRINNLTTMDDYTEHFKQAAKKRAEYFTSGRGGAVTKEDVARAMEAVRNRRK